jgi:integrase
VVPDEQPTTPLTPEEFAKLLDTVPNVIKEEREAARVRALFLLMRWTGLAIRDALTLSKEEVQRAGSNYRVVTSRQKTGTHVSVPLQSEIALELLATPNDNLDYFFWDGKRDAYIFTVGMGKKVRLAFEAAGLDDGQHMKSHRLRDTFAVELLQRGVPMEEVSKLLGHTSMKTTEKHYAKWVKGRQDRLDALVVGTWAA